MTDKSYSLSTSLSESSIFTTKDSFSEFYYLMNKNEKVLKFNSVYDVLKGYEIVDVYNESLLPFPCRNNLKYFNTWISDRPIPTNQEHINKVLESLKLTSRDIMSLLKVNNGFSLNDSYWIRPVTPNDYNVCMSWDKNNLYDNDFDESLGLVTFFGNISSLGGTFRSPEITNQGSVGKAWRRINGDLILFKKASEGASNLGKDHYSEVIASKVLDIIGLNHVDYWLGFWHHKSCSCCNIFTSEDVGYLPMYQFLDGLNINRNDWDYSTLYDLMPSDYDKQCLDDMIVLDFIIENWDRHFSNFGFLIDNYSQNIIKFAPIFDNGYSLMCRDLESDFKRRNYINYSNLNTFKLITNKDIASHIISKNPSRYKHWSKLIMTHLDSLVINECPNWYMGAVLDLIKSRCKYIQGF